MVITSGLNSEDLKNIPISEPGWHESTNSPSVDIRKKSFRVFTHSPKVEMLHIFSAGIRENIQYYHTILETFDESITDTPVGLYEMMSEDEIKVRFGITL